VKSLSLGTGPVYRNRVNSHPFTDSCAEPDFLNLLEMAKRFNSEEYIRSGLWAEPQLEEVERTTLKAVTDYIWERMQEHRVLEMGAFVRDFVRAGDTFVTFNWDVTLERALWDDSRGLAFWYTYLSDDGKSGGVIPWKLQFDRVAVEHLSLRDTPLFQSARKKQRKLTGKAIHVNDICRMMKRRLKDIGLPLLFSPHSFRVTTITDLLEQGVALEDVQRLAGHADPRTTRLYDRRERKITRNIVERISV